MSLCLHFKTSHTGCKRIRRESGYTFVMVGVTNTAFKYLVINLQAYGINETVEYSGNPLSPHNIRLNIMYSQYDGLFSIYSIERLRYEPII